MLPSWFRSINLLAVDGCFADPRLNGAIYLTREICDTTLMLFGHRKLGGSFMDFYGYFYGLSSSPKRRCPQSAIISCLAKNYPLNWRVLPQLNSWFWFVYLMQTKIRRCIGIGGDIRKCHRIGRFFYFLPRPPQSKNHASIKKRQHPWTEADQQKAAIPAPTKPFQPTGPSPPLIVSLCDNRKPSDHQHCNNPPITTCPASVPPSS